MSGLILNSRNSNDIPLHRHRIEVQCEQIFQRASSINKDLINRMQNAPIAKKHVFGFELKKIWLLLTLLLLFSCSLVGTILFWFTDTVDTFIMKNLVIMNGSDVYDSWLHPLARGQIKVYVFNYTNIEAFGAGIDSRLRVKEMGPYVYEESLERTNVYFEDDGTVTYQNVFKHKFLPHLSKGKQNDIVIAPNILVFSAVERTKYMDYWTRVAASMTIGGVMNQKPFVKLAVHRFIWGYDDSVYDLARGLLSFQNGNMQEQIGLFAQRNGTSPYVITVETGQKGMKNYGRITRVNGFDDVGLWSTKECNSVSASEGSMFPPNAVRTKQNLTVYVPDICRKLPLRFQKDVLIINNTVPAYRYIMPESVFDAPDKEPANQCYCDVDSVCPPQGFFNLTSCAFGAPLFLSMPYFKNVPISDVKVDGISRKHDDFVSFIDLHPTMGYPMVGMARFQVNVLAQSYPGFYSMDMFDKKGMMLPLAWFETGLEEKHINREYLEVIYLTTFTIKQVEMAIKYTTLLTTLMTLSAIIIILKARIQMHTRSSNLQVPSGTSA